MTNPTPDIPILDDDAVAEIAARANAATPGPWVYMTDEAFGGEIRAAGFGEGDNDKFEHVADTPKYDDRPDDMDFIAHARTDVPALCATVRVLRAENEQLLKWQADIQEREAAVCPEDVGFDEYIRTLEHREKN